MRINFILLSKKFHLLLIVTFHWRHCSVHYKHLPWRIQFQLNSLCISILNSAINTENAFRFCYELLFTNSKKVKWSRYRPGVAQSVGRGTALPFHDRGTRRGWVVSSTTRLHVTPGKDPVPILQEAGWAPGPVWTGGKSRPHRDSMPDRPARSQPLYYSQIV